MNEYGINPFQWLMMNKNQVAYHILNTIPWVLNREKYRAPTLVILWCPMWDIRELVYVHESNELGQSEVKRRKQAGVLWFGT